MMSQQQNEKPSHAETQSSDATEGKTDRRSEHKVKRVTLLLLDRPHTLYTAGRVEVILKLGQRVSNK